MPTAEQRLAQLKDDLANITNTLARADENVQTTLAQMKQAYGCATIAKAQDMHKRVIKEIPMVEAKLTAKLDEAAAVLDAVNDPPAPAPDRVTPSARAAYAHNDGSGPPAPSRGALRGTTRGKIT